MNLNKILFWAAVVCGVLAGVAGIAAAIVFKKAAFAVWGIFFIAGSIIVAVSGGKGRPDGSLQPSIGAKFTEVPTWAWLVITGLFVPAVALSFVFPPWK